MCQNGTRFARRTGLIRTGMKDKIRNKHRWEAIGIGVSIIVYLHDEQITAVHWSWLPMGPVWACSMRLLTRITWPTCAAALPCMDVPDTRDDAPFSERDSRLLELELLTMSMGLLLLSKGGRRLVAPIPTPLPSLLAKSCLRASTSESDFLEPGMGLGGQMGWAFLG